MFVFLPFPLSCLAFCLFYRVRFCFELHRVNKKRGFHRSIIFAEPSFYRKPDLILDLKSSFYLVCIEIKFFELKSRAKYLIQTIVFFWNRTLWEVQFLFFGSFFAGIEKVFILGGRPCAWGFEILLIFSNFVRSFLKSLGNSRNNSYLPCLFLIINLRFTCGDRKLWSNVKKSQYDHDVCKILFCFL